LCVLVASVHAQGTVSFANTTTLNRYQTNDLAGHVGNMSPASTYTIGLYIGVNGTLSNQLTLAVSTPNLNNGLFNGGNPYSFNTNTFAYAQPGATITVQIRAWTTAGGATYEAAYAAAVGGNSSIFVGTSSIANVTLGGGINGPAALFGTGAPFGTSIVTVSPVPEPATILLGCLGGAALLVARRRK
jgi:hypothetical protein